MKNFCISLFIVLLMIAGIILFDKWLFESVVATDWPLWVKYLILG